MHRSKLYAFAVLALLAMGAIVSVQASNGPVAPPPPPNPNGFTTNPGGGYDGPPAPISPPSGSKGGNTNPALVVHWVAGAEQYHFQVYRSMSNVLVAEAYTAFPRWDVAMPAQSPSHGLPVGVYSWTCSVLTMTGWSQCFRPNWTFEISKLSPPPVNPVLPPTPISPQSGSKGGNRNPELVVLGLAGAEEYHFCVYSVLSKSNAPVAEAYTTSSHWAVAMPVQSPMHGLPVGEYSWTCRVNMQGSWSDFFRPNWTFSVQKYSPPADGIVGNEKPWDPTIQPRSLPNPFGVNGTRVRMALPSNIINASAAVYSTEGRLVRKLTISRGSDGMCEFAWDGRDETGHSVGAGTYLCHITAGDMHKVVELVKSR